MKKKVRNIIIGIVAIILIIFLGYGGWRIYHFYHPDIELFVTQTHLIENVYYEGASVFFGGNTFFNENGMPKKIWDNLTEYMIETRKIDDELYKANSADGPTDIRVYGEIKDDKTYIYYIGEVTFPDEETKPYYKELVFDFPFDYELNLEPKPE